MKTKLLFSLLTILSLTSCGISKKQSIDVSFDSSNSNSSIVESSTNSDASTSNDSTITTSKSTSSLKSSNISSKISSNSKASSSTSKNNEVPTGDFKYSLENWTSFEFYNGTRGEHNSDWNYYYGTTKNPSGVLYNSPDTEGKGSVVHFEKYSQYMESPTFKSWKKIEFHFKLWFSAKTSSSYKAKDNEPQIILEHYKDETKTGYTNVELQRSDVPSNSTCYDLHLYIKDSEMNNIVFKFNNTVPNGNSGYTIVVHEISMKGWDYE